MVSGGLEFTPARGREFDHQCKSVAKGAILLP
jgi:hypothetical protein